MIRVFLDANILFSAAYAPETRLGVFFDLAQAGICELLSSAFALEEARRNLARKKPEALPQLAAGLSQIALVPEAPPVLLVRAAEFGLPAKDQPILAAAIAGRAAILVTGDTQHFGNLFGHTVGGVLVLRPADALRLLLEADSAG